MFTACPPCARQWARHRGPRGERSPSWSSERAPLVATLVLDAKGPRESGEGGGCGEFSNMAGLSASCRPRCTPTWVSLAATPSLACVSAAHQMKGSRRGKGQPRADVLFVSGLVVFTGRCLPPLRLLRSWLLQGVGLASFFVYSSLAVGKVRELAAHLRTPWAMPRAAQGGAWGTASGSFQAAGHGRWKPLQVWTAQPARL